VTFNRIRTTKESDEHIMTQPLDPAGQNARTREAQAALIQWILWHQVDGDPPPESRRLGPTPSFWDDAVRSLAATISLRDVAAAMPDGRAKDELGVQIDHAVSQFIDDFDTFRPRVSPYVGPNPPPGPRRESVASELSFFASTLPEGSVRSGLVGIAGQIVHNLFEAAPRRKLPSDEELLALTEFPEPDSECTSLCRDYLATMDELTGATGALRQQLHARLAANAHRRRELECKHCLPD
jgi:hypothetical protein